MSRHSTATDYLQCIFNTNKLGVTFISIGRQIRDIACHYNRVIKNHSIPISPFDSIAYDIALYQRDTPLYLFHVMDDYPINLRDNELKVLYPNVKIYEIGTDWLLETKEHLNGTTVTVHVTQEL